VRGDLLSLARRGRQGADVLRGPARVRTLLDAPGAQHAVLRVGGVADVRVFGGRAGRGAGGWGGRGRGCGGGREVSRVAVGVRAVPLCVVGPLAVAGPGRTGRVRRLPPTGSAAGAGNGGAGRGGVRARTGGPSAGPRDGVASGLARRCWSSENRV